MLVQAGQRSRSVREVQARDEGADLLADIQDGDVDDGGDRCAELVP